MIGPNLSELAIRSRSLMVYFMLMAVVAGSLIFLKLGRNEDPAFTFRTMIVQAQWPGATLDETLLQLTERIERSLQETPHIERIRSYSSPGVTTIFVDLKGSTPPPVVSEMWYQVRKRVGDMRHTLPQGVLGPFFNDDFGDTFGIIYGFVADGFSHRELRDQVEAARSRLLLVPDVSKVEIIGAQNEQVFIEFSTERLAGLGLNFSAVIAALQAQNAVRPAGVVETGDERLSLRVSGAFEHEDDIRAVNLVAGGRMFRLSDIAEIRRSYSDPPQPLFRVNGREAIGLAVAMREAGDILALGRNISAEMARIRAELPIGIEPLLVADQAVTVDAAIGEFITILWQAVLIIVAVSFLALGVRPGAVVALSIPLTLAIVFPVMSLAGIDLQRISLGALIIALTLLVDDAMTTVDAMIRRLGAGDSKEASATVTLGGEIDAANIAQAAEMQQGGGGAAGDAQGAAGGDARLQIDPAIADDIGGANPGWALAAQLSPQVERGGIEENLRRCSAINMHLLKGLATGVTTWAGQKLIASAGEESRSRLLVLTGLLVAFLTALISVNGAVAALLPVVVVMAVRLKRPPSQLLMPLVFSAHAGSLLALTGTPVNVLVANAALESGASSPPCSAN